MTFYGDFLLEHDLGEFRWKVILDQVVSPSPILSPTPIPTPSSELRCATVSEVLLIAVVILRW
jgi:hypothetical protein